ncbi:uncharacterized protein [Panulirus ornatus]|uniref:uncharacterized protein n=1 Tax=Panulirus ornatus TaxID=150431 RepID=UPI003A853B1E
MNHPVVCQSFSGAKCMDGNRRQAEATKLMRSLIGTDSVYLEDNGNRSTMIRYVAFFAVVIATVYGDIYLNPQPIILQRSLSRPVHQPVHHAPTPHQSFQAPLPSVSTTRNVPASNSLPSFTSPVLPHSRCDPIRKPLVDEIHNGHAYHFSWCRNYGQTYTWHDAINYCSSLGNGFQAVSIENSSEDDFLAQIISTHRIPHVWTSGNKLHSYYWTWQSNVNTGYTNWSHTGRRGLPQPDNDEQNENCLAILNNHYNDGITWHDSRCDALKHVICEARQFYH